MKKSTAYGSILAGAALWGIIGLWNRKLMALGLTPLDIVAVRNTGALLLLLAFFLLRDRHVFQIQREHFKYFLGTGAVSVLLFTCCYFSCQQLCSLAVASILLYTAPSFVVLLSALLWKEPVTRKKLLALFLTLAGCAGVCGLFEGDVSVTAKGILLGIGSGFFYGLYSIFGRYALKHYDSMTVCIWTFIVAGPASMMIFGGHAVRQLCAAPAAVPVTLGLALFSTALPYLLYTRGLQYVESGKASIMASLEPVVATLVGALVFHEPLSPLTFAGIICVLAGVIILR